MQESEQKFAKEEFKTHLMCMYSYTLFAQYTHAGCLLTLQAWVKTICVLRQLLHQFTDHQNKKKVIFNNSWRQKHKHSTFTASQTQGVAWFSLHLCFLINDILTSSLVIDMSCLTCDR